MTLRMCWTGQAKGVLGSWGIICLVTSLLLQQPGVHSKCYFQAQGKAGGGVRKGQGQRELGFRDDLGGLEMILYRDTQTPPSSETGETKNGGDMHLLSPTPDHKRSCLPPPLPNTLTFPVLP